MTEQQAPIHVVPTELERGDGFIDMAALAFSGLGVWFGVLHGVPVWPMLPPVLAVALWTLTGEPAADVPYLGAIAAGLRSKLGLRRASEWLLAWAHYFRVRTWPDWRTQWQNSRLKSAARTWLPWLKLPNVSGVLPSGRLPRYWSKS